MNRLLPLLFVICAAFASGSGTSHAGDAAAGEERYKKSCINCHGKNGKGVASFPSIVGKEAGYISKRLMQYRAGEKVGPNSALMKSWAKKQSDDDIANLAAYISSTFE